jgi:class 3 adenylate cyclase
LNAVAREVRRPRCYVIALVVGAAAVWVGLPWAVAITIALVSFAAGMLAARFAGSETDAEEERDRVLATVLFTDIVGSTDRASEIGDAAWSKLLERHHAAVRALIGHYRGTEVNTAGDGFFATFDGPARGVWCALAIAEKVRDLDIEIRAGLHTGELSTIDGRVGGLAVHIGARIGARAGPSEVLVSQTVKDLVAGGGLAFEDRGTHELKGVPGEWHLYAATAREAAAPTQVADRATSGSSPDGR